MSDITQRHLALFTTKVPYHSSHSGYEQLIKYLNADDVVFRVRKNADNFWIKNLERVLRRFTASKWYMWDGVEAEWTTWRKSRKHGDQLISHFLYGDNAIGLLPYFNDKLAGKLVLSVHACPSDLDEILHKPTLLQKVDALILLGSNQKHFFLKHGIPEEKLHIIPHGIDLDYFKPAENSQFHNSSKKTFDVLMIGNWRRNFPFYREVSESLKSHTDIRFTVVSQNHNAFHFDDLSNVTFLSGISDEKLRDLYQTSDALLLGLQDAVANNVLLEGMACGLPVVSERIGALPEYISEEACLFVDPNDADAALTHLKKIRDDSDLWKRHRKKSLAEVKNFEWSKIAAQIENVYASLSEDYNA